MPVQDVANYWKGREWTTANAALDGELEELLDRRLVKLGSATVQMHDLLVELGKEEAQKTSWLTDPSPAVSSLLILRTSQI